MESKKSPRAWANDRSSAGLSGWSQGMCSEIPGVVRTSLRTTSQSSIFSNTLRGSPGPAKWANRVPPVPRPHEGTDTRKAAARSVSFSMSIPRRVSWRPRCSKSSSSHFSRLRFSWAIRSPSNSKAMAPPCRWLTTVTLPVSGFTMFLAAFHGRQASSAFRLTFPLMKRCRGSPAPHPTSLAPGLSPCLPGPPGGRLARGPRVPCYALRNVEDHAQGAAGALHRALGGARHPDPRRLPVVRGGLAAARRGPAHRLRQGDVLPPAAHPPPLRPAGEGRREPLSPHLRDPAAQAVPAGLCRPGAGHLLFPRGAREPAARGRARGHRADRGEQSLPAEGGPPQRRAPRPRARGSRDRDPDRRVR